MSAISRPMRKAFTRPVTCFVKVTPQGFHLAPHDVPLPDEDHTDLTGRIDRMQLLRKRFEDQVLVCQSKDGKVATDGIRCEDCGASDCRPSLRIRLIQPGRTCYIELNHTSAENLFDVEDAAAAYGQPISNWPLRLTVRPHEYWGEVQFHRLEEAST